MRFAPTTLALHAAALTVLVGGATAFVYLDKTVTVSVDGKSREVRGFAGTVGDVLASEGIAVGPHDVVAPAPGTDLRDGSRVTVLTGRQITVDVDGKPRTVWSTARTVGEALDELGVRADGAYVSASRSRRIGRDGLAIDVRRPRAVTFVVDGKRVATSTTATSVGSALENAGLSVRPRDRVSVDLASPPTDGQEVRIVRVERKRVDVPRPIAFRTLERRTAELHVGETDVARDGRPGMRVVTVAEVYADGKRTARRIVGRKVTREAVDKVVLVGTKARPAARPEPDTRTEARAGSSRSSGSSGSAPSPSSDGLDWAALARCESGGNPRAVNPAGYYGLYQFSLATWQGVGGSGRPDAAPSSEQTARAQALYRRGGAGQWPTCGRLL